jgi:hypothetical protein
MNVRKSLFAVLVVGLLFGGSQIAEQASQRTVSVPQLTVDGGDPMPLPRPTRGGAIAAYQEANNVLVADGGDPMPRPPRRLA